MHKERGSCFTFLLDVIILPHHCHITWITRRLIRAKEQLESVNSEEKSKLWSLLRPMKLHWATRLEGLQDERYSMKKYRTRRITIQISLWWINQGRATRSYCFAGDKGGPRHQVRSQITEQFDDQLAVLQGRISTKSSRVNHKLCTHTASFGENSFSDGSILHRDGQPLLSVCRSWVTNSHSEESSSQKVCYLGTPSVHEATKQKQIFQGSRQFYNSIYGSVDSSVFSLD